ncbi:MAG TPA: tetratricopeptide repeat protein [Candidatus Binatia bacterium]|jgi:tetratricopeptide (TPR) repeat protein|nr:tetratricopeptide repeat protein [Candidatus Binatia bacterium]
MDLVYGDPEAGLASFQQAAELNPKYVANFTPLDEEVWTYVGRADYAAGNLAKARRDFQRALNHDHKDHMAQLYLGLVLAREGNRERGLKELKAGLRGVDNLLDHIQKYASAGQLWDPRGQIGSEIQKDLSMISGSATGWPTLIASGEWIGRKMEEESVLVREMEADRRPDKEL